MSRLDDAFRHFLIPESIWDADKLAELNDAATYNRPSIWTGEDWDLWEEECGRE